MVWTRISALCNGQQIVKTTPMSYQDPVLWVWPVYTPKIKRYQFKNKTLSPVIYFLAQYPERYSKISRCEPLESEHPKRNQNHLFNPWKVRQGPPCPFCKGVPHGEKCLPDKHLFHFTRLRCSDNPFVLDIRKMSKKIRSVWYLPRMQLKNLF